jgi:ABC-2 type transport system ATP-binding protein
MIDLVGLSNKQERIVEKLSGGETQRLGLAQAQIHRPDLLILDEPAASLDPIGRKDILNIMDELRTETTIFYSTHILDDVQKVSDAVAILNNGELISQGPIEDLLKGSEGIIYKIRLKGDPKGSYERIRELPWILEINSATMNETTTWQVSVSDKETAEKKLQREILKDENLSILSFNRKIYELEDIFMHLVGENNGN